MKKGDRVIIYTRVSTKEQAETGFSLPYQLKVLQEFCKVKGLEIVAHFEEDYSAKTFDRPEWKKLMELVKSKRGKVDSVLFVRWDRFSRNMTEAWAVMKELRDYGVEVNAMEQPLDLSTPDSKLMLSIYLITPEIENDKNSQRTKNGSYQARSEGGWTGTAPFGYANWRTEDKKPSLVIDPSEAEIVRFAFDAMAKGIYSAEEVRKMVKEMGKTFSKQVFLNLLRNVTYTGKVHLAAYGKNDAMIVEGLHKAIIAEDQFHEVQAILSGRTRRTAYKKVKRTDALALRGYLICKNCGRNLTGSRSKGRSNSYFYYHCNCNTCKERFRADQANEDFLRYLDQYNFKDEVVDAYYAVLEDVFNTHEKERFDQIKQLEIEYERFGSLQILAMDKYLEELIGQKAFDEATERYERKQNEIAVQIMQLKGQESEYKKYLRYGLSLLGNLPHYYNHAALEIKQSMLGIIFPEKLVYESGDYRTARLNEVLYLMLLTNNDLEGNKNGADQKSAPKYWRAPPSGLEPETL
ncbi:recombinase family protein [Dinghuibacter silviterrae]|uniref:recombinase family protein n=1 Tax=Dinghuibacter silviterrae TaxID=1539049 RepID=UPI00106397B8|nr:recombinase family protein [Dinghuibacter silviterrae]